MHSDLRDYISDTTCRFCRKHAWRLTWCISRYHVRFKFWITIPITTELFRCSPGLIIDHFFTTCELNQNSFSEVGSACFYVRYNGDLLHGVKTPLILMSVLCDCSQQNPQPTAGIQIKPTLVQPLSNVEDIGPRLLQRLPSTSNPAISHFRFSVPSSSLSRPLVTDLITRFQTGTLKCCAVNQQRSESLGRDGKS